MQKNPYKYSLMIGALASAFAVSAFAVSAFAVSAFAQTAPPQPPDPSQQATSNGGWRPVGNSNPSPDVNVAPPAANQNYPQDPQQPPPQPPPQQNNQPNVPPTLTLKPGAYVTVRLNNYLSSDKNQPGDAFSATLVRPVIVDGIVVAAPGQTLGGRVTEAKKAGRVEGTSRLGIELTDLPIVDGQQVPIKTQFISRNGPTSVGRDAAAIGGTTAAGAAIGAGVGWGTGAAIGAGAGALVGIVGVLVTRGHPTILGPETLLTFRVEQPLTISTEHSPYAFRFVNETDYQTQQQPRLQSRPGYGPPPAAYAPGYAGYGYGYPGYYPGYYPYNPYYWGPGIGVYFGGGWGRGYGRGFGGRGFRR